MIKKEMTNFIQLCSHDECSGCFACEGICSQNAIIQTLDKEGFKYPVIDIGRCISCHACENICPALKPIEKYPRGNVYAAWSLDNKIRSRSSSGGIFSELALSILNEGGVVVGASMNDNGYVNHTIIDDAQNLVLHCGSKYVQSNLNGNIYKEVKKILNEGRKVLFTGCPCQVAGIRSFFKNKENLYTMDLICHGVPSPELFSKVFMLLKNLNPNFISYNFRNLNEWAGCNSVNINIKKGKSIINQALTGELTFYQDAFMKGLLSRYNCYECKYTTIERIGDITVGDFWGIGKFKQINSEYKYGCSMVSINSNKGEKLFNTIKDHIFYEPRSIEETIQGGNEQIIKPSLKPIDRNSFYEDFQNLSLNEVIKKYNLKVLKKENIFHKIKKKIEKKINK